MAGNHQIDDEAQTCSKNSTLVHDLFKVPSFLQAQENRSNLHVFVGSIAGFVSAWKQSPFQLFGSWRTTEQLRRKFRSPSSGMRMRNWSNLSEKVLSPKTCWKRWSCWVNVRSDLQKMADPN